METIGDRLDQTIVDFYTWRIQSNKKFSNDELRGIFFNKLKGNLKDLYPDISLDRLINVHNLKFSMNRRIISQIEFNINHSPGKMLLTQLSEAAKQANYNPLGIKNVYYRRYRGTEEQAVQINQ